MSIYVYYCPFCDHSFEIKQPMMEQHRDAECPKCGQTAGRQYTPIAHTFGWRLDEQSHIRGHKDKLERDI